MDPWTKIQIFFASKRLPKRNPLKFHALPTSCENLPKLLSQMNFKGKTYKTSSLTHP